MEHNATSTWTRSLSNGDLPTTRRLRPRLQWLEIVLRWLEMILLWLESVGQVVVPSLAVFMGFITIITSLLQSTAGRRPPPIQGDFAHSHHAGQAGW